MTYIFMRHKRLDDKIPQLSDSRTDLLVFAHSLLHPLFNLFEVFIDRNQSQFAATLDQLVGFHDERLIKHLLVQKYSTMQQSKRFLLIGHL